MGEVKPSTELDRKVRMVRSRLDEAGERLWSHPDLAQLVPTFLFRMYSESRATVHLLETAVECFEARLEADPCASDILRYLRKLIPEETHHDDWLLEGLEALGVSREEVRARIPPASVAALVGSQYYWLHHHDPVAILGYIKVVEMDPPPIDVVDRIVQETGLPRETFVYHSRHAYLELKHNDDLDRLLDALQLSEDQWALIGISAFRTVHYLATVLEEIFTLYESGGRESLQQETVDFAVI